MREPTLAWWPGHIPPGTVSAGLASTMDIFATVHSLLKINLPTDRVLDSYDMTPMLLGQGPSHRKLLFYYRGYRLMAVRKGPWKLHFITQAGYGEKPRPHDPPLLFQVEQDPSEKYDVAAKHPEVVREILRMWPNTANTCSRPRRSWISSSRGFGRHQGVARGREMCHDESQPGGWGPASPGSLAGE